MKRIFLSILIFLAIFVAASAYYYIFIRKPNVILVCVDTLRPDYLGAYGFPADISPNIDKLAKSSIQFNNAYAPSPWTPPSINALFTGKYPKSKPWPLPKGKVWGLIPKNVTIAEILKDNGYRTGAFVWNDYLDKRNGYDQGFNHYVDKRVDFQQGALNWIQQKKFQPFFLYLHYIDVHGPYKGEYKDVINLKDHPIFGPDRDLSEPEIKRRPKSIGLYLEKWHKELNQKNLWRAAYAAGIKKFDKKFGKLLDQLEEAGTLKNTIIIFTSDHGEELLEHNNWGHGFSLMEHQLRIPLLIRVPGWRAKHFLIDDPVSLIDILPTVLNMARITYEPAIYDGISLTPYLKDPFYSKSRALFGMEPNNQKQRFSIIKNKAKLIWNFNKGKGELFYLPFDPHERINVIGTQKVIAQELKKDLVKFHENFKKSPETLRGRPMDKEVIENLKSLGYLQ